MGKLLDTFKKMRANQPVKDRLSTPIELNNQPDLSQYNDDIIEGDNLYQKHKAMKKLTLTEIIIELNDQSETGRYLDADMFHSKIYSALKTAELLNYRLYNETTKKFSEYKITSNLITLLYEMHLGHGVSHLILKQK